MQTPISLNTLKLHNERLNEMVAELEAYFSFEPPTPSSSMEEIMYSAGQASVVNYIKSKLEEED